MQLAGENNYIIIMMHIMMHVRTRKILALMQNIHVDEMQLTEIVNLENSVKKSGPTQTYAIRRNMQLSNMHIAGADCILQLNNLTVCCIQHRLWYNVIVK